MVWNGSGLRVPVLTFDTHYTFSMCPDDSFPVVSLQEVKSTDSSSGTKFNLGYRWSMASLVLIAVLPTSSPC